MNRWNYTNEYGYAWLCLVWNITWEIDLRGKSIWIYDGPLRPRPHMGRSNWTKWRWPTCHSSPARGHTKYSHTRTQASGSRSPAGVGVGCGDVGSGSGGDSGGYFPPTWNHLHRHCLPWRPGRPHLHSPYPHTGWEWGRWELRYHSLVLRLTRPVCTEQETCFKLNYVHRGNAHFSIHPPKPSTKWNYKWGWK